MPTPVHGIEDLREQRAGLFEQMKTISAKAKEDARDLTAEEDQEYQRIDGEFDALSKRIEREEKEAGIEAKMSRSTAAPDADGSPAGDGKEKASGRDSDGYKEAFESYVRTRGGMGEAMKPEQFAALAVGVDSTGGYLVPDEFHTELVQSARTFGVMRQLARIIPTSNNGDLLISTVATRATAAWTAEAVAFTESEDTFGRVTLAAFKLGAIAKVSDEMVSDSYFPIMSFLARSLGEAIGLLENTAFVVGTSGSTTSPEGLFAKATVGTTAVGTNVITAGELIDLYHSVIQPYRRGASWIMKDATAKAVRKLAESTGQFLWQPGLQAGMPDTLLGQPVWTDPDVDALATGKKVIAFGDIAAAYWIRDVEGITAKVLNELYAASGQVGFRISRRTDGDLVDAAAVRLLLTA